MILLVGSQKGGSGKSTVVTNLAVSLAEAGRSVVVVDADPQGTSLRWGTDRERAILLPQIKCVQKAGDLRSALMELKQLYEFVLVDVSGRDSKELRSGMLAADHMIIPTRPSQPDLDTLFYVQELIKEARRSNPRLTAHALITNASTQYRIRDREISEAKDYIKDFKEIEAMSSVIYDRVAFRSAISLGKSVIELGVLKAKDDVIEVRNEVLSWS
jgi:chromosome partitioning protein